MQAQRPSQGRGGAGQESTARASRGELLDADQDPASLERYEERDGALCSAMPSRIRRLLTGRWMNADSGSGRATTLRFAGERGDFRVPHRDTLTTP